MGRHAGSLILALAPNAVVPRCLRHIVYQSVSVPLASQYRPMIPNTKLASVFGAFFRKGQVLETFRGKGIYQPAVDSAIEKLSNGAWVRRSS